MTGSEKSRSATHDTTPPWCCRHTWTLSYISAVVTLELVLLTLQATGHL